MPAAASSSDLALTVQSWVRDPGSGAVQYSVQATGTVGTDTGPCDDSYNCALEIRMYKQSSSGAYLDKGLLASESWSTWAGQSNVPYALNATYASTGAGIKPGEVTHLRLQVRPTGDYYNSVANARTTWQTPMIQVESPVTADRAVTLTVNQWSRDASTGVVQYSLGATGPVGLDNGPCHGGYDCALEITMYKVSATGAVTNKGTLVTESWSNWGGQNNVPYVLNRTYTSPTAGIRPGEVTHLQLTLRPTGDYYNSVANARTTWQADKVRVEEIPGGRSLVLYPTRWLREPNGQTKYTLTASGTVGLDVGPCHAGYDCRLEIRAVGPNSSGAIVDRGLVAQQSWSNWGGQDNVPYRLNTTYTSEGTYLGTAEITGLRLSVYPAGDYYNSVANARQAWHATELPIGVRVQDGVNIDAAATAFAAAAVMRHDPCIESFPVAPNTDATSSLNDLQQYCETLRAQGIAWGTIANMIAASFGAHWLLVSQATDDDPQAPALDPRPPTPGAPLSPRLPRVEATTEEVLTALMMQRQRITGWEFTDPANARAAARQVVLTCLRMSVLSLASNISPTECGRKAIFAPGHDVLEPAQHDWDAIRVQPSWGELTFATTAEKEGDGYVRGWYNRVAHATDCPDPRPVVNGAATDCDEYPFFASEEGGSESFDTKPQPSLRIVNAVQNQLEGRLWRNFAYACRIPSAPRQSQERTVLVIPIIADGSTTPTTGWC